MKNRKKKMVKIDWKNETAKSKRKIADMIVSGQGIISVISGLQCGYCRQNKGGENERI